MAQENWDLSEQPRLQLVLEGEHGGCKRYVDHNETAHNKRVK